VWYVDPKRREVQVFSSVTSSQTLGERDTLDGGDVLKGFALSIHDLFAELPPE
jgi:hypothetical protein